MILRKCESYSVPVNRWKELPSLKIPRKAPGSILLKSRTAFCFYGDDADAGENGIESLQLEIEEVWMTLAHSSGLDSFG